MVTRPAGLDDHALNDLSGKATGAADAAAQASGRETTVIGTDQDRGQTAGYATSAQETMRTGVANEQGTQTRQGLEMAAPSSVGGEVRNSLFVAP